MEKREVTRREVVRGGAALAGLAALGVPLAALAAPVAADEVVIPWLDQPPAPPPPPLDAVWQQLKWEELGSQITPNEKFFVVTHHGMQIIREPGWRLEIGGLVQRPLSLTLADIRALPRREVAFTLEGNDSGFGWRRRAFDGGQPAAGEHTDTPRAFDRAGNVQPAPTGPVIANKRTYWESNGQITRRVRIA